MESLLALLFIGLGLWAFISPKSALDSKASIAKSLGIKITASPKAYKTYKYIGLGAAIVGFLLYFS